MSDQSCISRNTTVKTYHHLHLLAVGQPRLEKWWAKPGGRRRKVSPSCYVSSVLLSCYTGGPENIDVCWSYASIPIVTNIVTIYHGALSWFLCLPPIVVYIAGWAGPKHWLNYIHWLSSFFILAIMFIKISNIYIIFVLSFIVNDESRNLIKSSDLNFNHFTTVTALF